MQLVKLPPELLLIIFEWALDLEQSLDLSTVDDESDRWIRFKGLSPYSIENFSLEARTKSIASLARVCRAWNAMIQGARLRHLVFSNFWSWNLLKGHHLKTFTGSAMPIIERIDIDMTNNSKWPEIDGNDVSSIIQPLRTISEDLQIFTLALNGDDEDALRVTLGFLDALPHSLRGLEWIKKQTWESASLVGANSIAPIIQHLGRFVTLEVLSLGIPREIDDSLSCGDIHLPNLRSLYLVGVPDEVGSGLPPSFVLMLSLWNMPVLKTVSMTVLHYPLSNINHFFERRGRNLIQLRLSGYPTPPDFRCLENLESMVAPLDAFSRTKFTFSQLKSIAITRPSFDSIILGRILNMNNPNLKQVRLLEYDNSIPFQGKKAQLRLAVERYAMNGIRLEESSGELLSVL
jgi:hypothetical protein